jgi:sugar lactone lactonase YvrE
MKRVFLLFAGLLATSSLPAEQDNGNSIAAVPGEIGGQDITGPYNVAKSWPAELSALPGHEGWTWGTTRGVFAQTPNRIFVVQVSEQPIIERPAPRNLHDVSPASVFPVARLPWRSPRGGGRDGIDTRSEHSIVVLNGAGEVIEEWTQWDDLVRSPHAVHINPYDPDKHVWVIDDRRHAIFKFTNDGTELVQTLGVVDEQGTDQHHFSWPTYIAWAPDGSFYVADGGMFHDPERPIGSRVVKFDAEGNYQLEWGHEGVPPEGRPGYFNNVHGIAIDAETDRIFVNDRQNHRVQIFSTDGEYLDEWAFGDNRSDIHLFIITEDRNLWAIDRGTNKVLKYSLDGRLLYSWGTWGAFEGGFWGVHGISVDSEGNFYTAEVDGGRVQKFVPRNGARPAYLVGTQAH